MREVRGRWKIVQAALRRACRASGSSTNNIGFHRKGTCGTMQFIIETTAREEVSDMK